jgi:flagellar assembly factor FliW
MISFETTRFGRLEVGKDKIISFPSGLMGFSEYKRYILMDYKDTSLKWLQAVDAPHVAFIVVQPFEFFPDYSVSIEDSIRDLLEIEHEDDVSILTILRVEGEKVTVNLQGPLVMNSLNKKGMQIVNDDPRFSCKAPLHPLSVSATK